MDRDLIGVYDSCEERVARSFEKWVQRGARTSSWIKRMMSGNASTLVAIDKRMDSMEVIMSVRTTVQIDEEVFDRLRRLVPPRGLSRFINEAVAEKVEAMEHERIA